MVGGERSGQSEDMGKENAQQVFSLRIREDLKAMVSAKAQAENAVAVVLLEYVQGRITTDEARSRIDEIMGAGCFVRYLPVGG